MKHTNNCIGKRSGFAPRRQYSGMNVVPPVAIVPVMPQQLQYCTNNQPYSDTKELYANQNYTIVTAYKNNNNNNGNCNLSSQNEPTYDNNSQIDASFNNASNSEMLQIKSNSPNNTIKPGDELNMSDLKGCTMKTPVSLLQEILSRRGITPNYELVQIEGAIHEPTFRYRVSFNDKEVPFTAMGAGRSKKEAKHSAAKALIDKLSGVQPGDSQTNIYSSTSSMPNYTYDTCATGSEECDRVIGNPIGWLQEMCMSRRWPPPVYEMETEIGLPHERLFTIACTILNFREVGKGKSKKIAKRMAAHKMWSRLQETPPDSENMLESMRSDCDKIYYGEFKDIITSTTSGSHGKNSQFHKSLKNATGKKLLNLQQMCLADTNIDFINLLSEVGHENRFEITYVDIEEKSFSNQYQCLVQLSTLPVGVCHGNGDTPAEARKEAAQHALQFLKIMTKK